MSLKKEERNKTSNVHTCHKGISIPRTRWSVDGSEVMLEGCGLVAARKVLRSAQFRRRKRCLWRIPSTRPRPGDACKANLASMSHREKAAFFEQHPECSFHTALLLLCRPFFSLRGSAGVRCRVSLTRFQLTLLPISTSSLSPNLRRIVVFSLARWPRF